MTQNEITQKISQLEGSIADAERRRAEAEKNIYQLEALKACCNDYQTEFEFSRNIQRARLEDFVKIEGQDRLIGAYDMVLRDLLNGPEYIRAYEDMEMAKSEVSREIERHRQVINECNGQIVGFSSSISVCRQQLADADKEVRNAG